MTDKILEILKDANAIPRYDGPAARDGELVLNVKRFYHASNRLEVLRGIKHAADKLFIRLIDRFGPINLRDGVHNYRFFNVDKDAS